MAQDPTDDLQTTPQLVTASPRGGGKPMLFLGVVGACALGVGAGLWARPHEDERRATPVAARVAEAPKPVSRILEIVVDDAPAPIGAPIEVLPAMVGQGSAHVLPAMPPMESQPIGPLRAPTGLVRVQAVEPIAIEAEPAPKPVARPAPKPVEKPKAVEKAKETRKVAKAETKAKPPERKLVKAETSKAEKARKAKEDAKLAKAEKAKAAKLAKAEAKPSKLSKALAKVSPAKVKQAAESSKTKLADARKARADKKKAEAARAEAARVEKARLAKAQAEKARVQKAALKKAPAKAEPAKARPVIVKPTRDNPIRKASNRCVSADPGAALVCADAALGAADRQMTRAYQQATAAGVSAAQLARQQERWLAARAQAAKEAPWAVRDVYEARIAELNDMTRDARREY